MVLLAEVCFFNGVFCEAGQYFDRNVSEYCLSACDPALLAPPANGCVSPTENIVCSSNKYFYDGKCQSTRLSVSCPNNDAVTCYFYQNGTYFTCYPDELFVQNEENSCVHKCTESSTAITEKCVY